MKFQRRKTHYMLLAVIVTFIILHIPTLANPYHYDAVAWVSQSKYLLENGLFSIPPQDFGHPYFLFWVLALSYKIFGESVIVSHSVILIFSVIALLMTFFIGKELFGEKIGLLATIFLSVQPWFFVVSNWVYFDIPLTALFTTTMYFLIRALKTEDKKYYFLFVLFGSMTALTKAPGILVSVIPLVYVILKRRFKWEFLLFLIPAIALISWTVWHTSVKGYAYDPSVERGILIPTDFKNIFLIGKNYTTNIFFNFIQNGNFIAFLIITYSIFFKKYEKIYLLIALLFLIFGNYLFLLKEPDMKFYPFLFLGDVIFTFWVIQTPKLKDEYKILLIWITAVMLHSFYAQISFRYGLPLLPAFSILFATAIQKISQRKIVLIFLFGLLILQIYNYTNYYINRDTIYLRIFEYFDITKPETVMVAYPLATPDLIAVKEIDSRPWDNITVYLVPNSKEEFLRIAPQYLVVDERAIEFNYTYIQDIVRNRLPEMEYSKEINWYTYLGIRNIFINRLRIYKIQ